jgi:hypothetical protein
VSQVHDLTPDEAANLNPLPGEGKPKNLTVELWREYDFGGRVYRIDNPKELYHRPGGTTHRVVDSVGVVHCLPAPGQLGCVLRWQSKDPSKPVDF